MIRSLTSGRRYRIKGRLGEGGFGVAYRATPLGESGAADICIKVTRDAPSWHRESYLGEMFRENPRVIQVLDSFPLAGRRHVDYVLALELAEHGDLRHYLARDPTPWNDRRILGEIAGLLKPLDQLHVAGGMHRDITPFNVLVCDGKTLKLGDFGIVRHAPRGGLVRGSTFNWGFAPQSVLNDDSVWRASDDIWQIGQLMAFLVEGRIREPIQAIHVRRLRCGPRLKAIIRRAIGSRSIRYRDAYELQTDLAASKGHADTVRGRITSLQGKTVVFTGRLWTRREDATRLVLRCGGEAASYVSAKTNVIVRGAVSPHYAAGTKGMKLIEAEVLRERGKRIVVINERQFRRLVHAGS